MLIDAHTHLDRYDRSEENLLQDALTQIHAHQILSLSNSMDPPSYRRNLEIADSCEFVLPIFGVHPWNAPQYALRLDELVEPIHHSPMLGEIGLDFHFVQDRSHYPAQQTVFEFILSAAEDQGKIVILHTKGAEQVVLDTLARYDLPHVIVHWYSGPLDVFHKLVDRGVSFTIGVELLYSEHIQAIARQVPLDQLLTETDNPGGLFSLTGQPGMPSTLIEVVHTLADVRRITVDDLLQTVQHNLLRQRRANPWLKGTCLDKLESNIIP